MILLKISLIVLFNLVLVIKNNCVPIGDNKDVIEYLKNFGYLTEDEKISLKQISNDHESLKADNRLKRALKNLQKNGNIPITGKYDERTAALMETPRCGVTDEILNKKREKRYALMSTKWPTTNLTYRFDHMNNDKFVKDEDNIRRIIREAFNVWEKDTVMKFTESKEDKNADILISFQHPKHIKIDPHIFSSTMLGHAFQPGKDLGGDVHLNELIQWDLTVSYDSRPQEGKISFYEVILHLIGHSLGLDHTLDNEAVMYEFYSRGASTLAEDDIRAMHSIYGVPKNRKYIPSKKQEEIEEERPTWNQTPRIPNKCNTSYDAIAMIDGEVVAFKGKFMFGPNKDVIEIRSRWRGLSPRMTHVDGVHQTTDGKTLFFIGQALYYFVGTKLEKIMKLSDIGIDSSVLKIDAIFRKADSQRTYIFIGNNYYRFDEHKLMVTGYSNRISKVFRDVYDMGTAFTYNNGKTYFFKNEFSYEFRNHNWMLQRMKPELSANFFMNCEIVEPNSYAEKSFYLGGELDYSGKDYIDQGPGFFNEPPDCDNPEVDLCGPNSAVGIENFKFLIALLLTISFFI